MDWPSLGQVPSSRVSHVQGTGFHKMASLVIPPGWSGGGSTSHKADNNQCPLCSSSEGIWGVGPVAITYFSPEQTTWPLLMTAMQPWAESLFLLPPLLHRSVRCTWADFFQDCMSGA